MYTSAVTSGCRKACSAKKKCKHTKIKIASVINVVVPRLKKAKTLMTNHQVQQSKTMAMKLGEDYNNNMNISMSSAGAFHERFTRFDRV